MAVTDLLCWVSWQDIHDNFKRLLRLRVFFVCFVFVFLKWGSLDCSWKSRKRSSSWNVLRCSFVVTVSGCFLRSAFWCGWLFPLVLFLLMVAVVLGQGDIYLWPKIHPVLKYDLEPLVLFIQPSKCRDYGLCHVVEFMWCGVGPGALCLLGKHSATWAVPSSLRCFWLTCVRSRCGRE